MGEQEVKVYVEKPRRYLIAKATARFDKAKEAVESAEGGKFKIPAVWLNQQVRQEREYKDDVSTKGNWVLEGVLYRQKANNVFSEIGLPYLHPKEAVLATTSKGKGYTLERCTQNEVDKAIAEGLEINPKDLDENGNLIIPCKEFDSNKYGLWFFGGKGNEQERSNRAKESGAWLIKSPQKINYICVRLDNKDYTKQVGEDYAIQMWFWGLDFCSELDGGRGWDLRFGLGVLGVSDSAEGAAQNSTKI